MNNINRCFFILILFVFLSQSPLAKAITIDELADRCEAMEDSISDVTAEYEFIVDPLPEPEQNVLVGTGPVKIKWSGAKPFSEFSRFSSDEILKDISGKEGSVHISTSYNGKIAKKYQDEDLPGYKPEGTITNKRNFMPIWSKTPLIYTSYFFQITSGRPLNRILRGEGGLIVELDNEIKKVNGFNTIRADIYRYIEDTKVHVRGVCFSPEHNFAVVKIELFNGQKSAASFDVLELEEVKDGIWFPVHGCRSDSSPEVPKNIIKVTSVVINQGLNKEYFDIEFPPGTRIINEISALSYIDEAQEDQNDTNTNGNFKDSEPVIEVQKPQAPAETKESKKTIIYISIAAIFFLLVTLTVKKYV